MMQKFSGAFSLRRSSRPRPYVPQSICSVQRELRPLPYEQVSAPSLPALFSLPIHSVVRRTVLCPPPESLGITHTLHGLEYYTPNKGLGAGRKTAPKPLFRSNQGSFSTSAMKDGKRLY